MDDAYRAEAKADRDFTHEALKTLRQQVHGLETSLNEYEDLLRKCMDRAAHREPRDGAHQGAGSP
jgi:hypothetical protein